MTLKKRRLALEKSPAGTLAAATASARHTPLGDTLQSVPWAVPHKHSATFPESCQQAG
jgi:hypothetical protein